MTIKSADNLIIQTENEKLGKQMSDPVKEEKPQQKSETPSTDLKEESKEVEQLSDDQAEPELPSKEAEDTQENQEKLEGNGSKKESSSDETDDYGNPVAKGKTYTEEQVNAMIRDRLARERQSRTQQQQQQVQDAAKDFQADPESTESWENQLEGFIEKTINKISSKNSQEEWKRKEEGVQAEFETKFTQGMTRYDDFRDVVSDKPITDSMMMATRGMKDPAAFVYSACKTHPEEIARIAQIPDAVTQITEIGRLEERMKKPRVLTKSPVPSKKVSGDVTDDFPRLSVDQRIAEHAKSKIMHRGK